MFYSIDRIVEEVAFCIGDEEDVLLLSTDRIIGSYCEGSVISEGEDGYYYVDSAEEEKRRDENFAFAESLFDE